MLPKPLYDYFEFNGKNSLEFNVRCSNTGTWKTPNKRVSTETVVGRNGDVLVTEDGYEDVTIPYDFFVVDNFENKFLDFGDFLNASKGFCRLEDAYHPDEYRMARVEEGLDPEVVFNEAGSATINFICHPERWLKSGEVPIELPQGNHLINNPTRHTAKPLIYVRGTGKLRISDIEIEVLNNSGNNLVLDCDTEDAYTNGTLDNRNSDISTTSTTFFLLPVGTFGITVPAGMSISLIPRWYNI